MAGLVIFSPDVRRLAHFYEAVLGLTPVSESSGDVRLRGDRDEILVHSMSARAAATLAVSSPPRPRDAAAIKPIFDVPSLVTAVAAVVPAGGVDTGRTFHLNGLTRHDVLDPDGNVVQLRAPA